MLNIVQWRSKIFVCFDSKGLFNNFENIYPRSNFLCLRFYNVIQLTQQEQIPLVHTYVLNASLTSHSSCTTKYFWKKLMKVRSPNLYASFGTFCAQIGQLFEEQSLKYVWKSTNRCYRREMSSISEFFWMFKDSLCRE